MIRKILTYYAERLEEYLSRFHRRPEGLATVGMIGNSTEERPNKMVVSLLNVERETAGGIAAPVQRTADGGYARHAARHHHRQRLTRTPRAGGERLQRFGIPAHPRFPQRR